MLDRECPVCLNRDSIRSLSTGWTCNKCSHTWRPEPWKNTDTIKHFDNASYTTQEPPAVQHVHVKLFEAFEQLASATVEGKLMLDFGCAYGIGMEVFKKKGWGVFGIEIATSSQKILTEKKLRWAPTLQESGIDYGSVDVIVMADCIYYLPDPVQTLSQLRKYLTPRGILLLRQPTRAGLARVISRLPGTSKILQSIWCDHIHLFSRSSTIAALVKAGFMRVDILKERDFERRFINQVIHQILHCFDLITFHLFDLTLSWTVCAGLCLPLNRMWFSIRNEKITLRRVKLSDFRDVYDAIKDSSASQSINQSERALAKNAFSLLLRRMPRYAGKTIRYLWWKLFPPKERRIFRFCISLNENGKITGMVILTRKGKKLDYAEVGFWISKKYWGKGLTTDALKMVVDFAFNHLALKKIEGWTVPENVASQKVMEKCGFTLCGSDYNRDARSENRQDGLWFRILKSEYHGEYGTLIPEKIYAE